MKTSDLIEQRTAIVARMNEAHSADNGEAFTAAEIELRSVDDKLTRQRSLDAADRTDPGTPIHGTDANLDRELRSFSISRMIASMAGMPVDAGRERELQGELAKRAGKPAQGFYAPTEIFEQRDVQLTTNSGAILPTDYRPDLFTSALTASAVVTTLGATVLTGLTGNVDIPRETGSPAVGWVAENTALPTGNAAFDSVTLSPHHVGAISEMSRNMVMQASPDIEQLMRNMLARNISLEIDRAAVTGSGTGAEPRGILKDPAVPAVPFDTDLFITTANMIATADLANVSTTRGFLSTNAVKAEAMRTRDGNGLAIPVTATFHGEPTQFSNQVPHNLGTGLDEQGLIYGDWRDFLIGIWSQLDILVNPYAETAYSKGNLLIRAMATVDFGIRRPASFVKATGITVA